MSASFLWAPAAMEQRTTTNIKTLQRQKEEDGCDFGASLVYIIDQPGLHSELLKQGARERSRLVDKGNCHA